MLVSVNSAGEGIGRSPCLMNGILSRISGTRKSVSVNIVRSSTLLSLSPPGSLYSFHFRAQLWVCWGMAYQCNCAFSSVLVMCASVGILVEADCTIPDTPSLSSPPLLPPLLPPSSFPPSLLFPPSFPPSSPLHRDIIDVPYGSTAAAFFLLAEAERHRKQCRSPLAPSTPSHTRKASLPVLYTPIHLSGPFPFS